MSEAEAAPPRKGKRRSRYWWLATAALVLVAAGFLTVGLRGDNAALAGPVPPRFDTSAAPAAPAPGGAGAAPAAPVPAVGRSTPLELRVPAIGVTVAVSELGLNPDRTVEVPTDFQKAGWFRLGPTPGQLGSAVILGHVDSYRGPAVFYRLRSLEAGDAVDVSRADGSVAHFVVDTVATYPKSDFPAAQVYASHGGSDLQLVTCGGEFDRSARSYLSNVVAYTSLVSITPAPVAVAPSGNPN